jgi:hypothetical protein
VYLKSDHCNLILDGFSGGEEMISLLLGFSSGGTESGEVMEGKNALLLIPSSASGKDVLYRPTGNIS